MRPQDPPALAFGAPAVLVLLVAGMAALLRSRSEDEQHEPDEDEPAGDLTEDQDA